MTSHSRLHYYKVQNKKYIPHVGEKPLRDVIIDYLDVFKEGDIITVSIKKYKSQRSSQQNRYMHFVFNLIASETGNDMEDIKSFHKMEHFPLPTEYIEVGGVKRPKENHTSDLNTEQQEIFMDRVRRFWLDFNGMVIPLPNEIDLE